MAKKAKRTPEEEAARKERRRQRRESERNDPDGELRRAERRHRRELRKQPQGLLGRRLRLSFKSVVCNVFESIFIFMAISAATAGFLTYDWISSDRNEMLKVEIYPPINAPGFQTVSCGLTSFCIDAAGELSQCSVPWPRYGDGNMLDVSVYPSKVWFASAALIASGIGLMTLTWLYTLVACFGCFREPIHRFFLRVLELGGVCLAAGLITFGFSLGDTGVDDARCFARSDTGKCEKWYATLPSQQIEGNNASCQFCPQTSMFQMSTACSFGWGGLAIIIAVVLAGIATQFGTRVTPRKKQVKYRWAESRKRKDKEKKDGAAVARKSSSRRSEGAAGATDDGIVHTGERVQHPPPDIVDRLNEMDEAARHGHDDDSDDTDDVLNNGGAIGFVNVIPNHLSSKESMHSNNGEAPPPPPISTIPGRKSQSPRAVLSPSDESMYAEIVSDLPPYPLSDMKKTPIDTYDPPRPSAPPADTVVVMDDHQQQHQPPEEEEVVVAGTFGPPPARNQSLKLSGGDDLHEMSETDLTTLMVGGGDVLNESTDTDHEALATTPAPLYPTIDDNDENENEYRQGGGEDGSPLRHETALAPVPMEEEDTRIQTTVVPTMVPVAISGNNTDSDGMNDDSDGDGDEADSALPTPVCEISLEADGTPPSPVLSRRKSSVGSEAAIRVAAAGSSHGSVPSSPAALTAMSFGGHGDSAVRHSADLGTPLDDGGDAWPAPPPASAFETSGAVEEGHHARQRPELEDTDTAEATAAAPQPEQESWAYETLPGPTVAADPSIAVAVADNSDDEYKDADAGDEAQAEVDNQEHQENQENQADSPINAGMSNLVISPMAGDMDSAGHDDADTINPTEVEAGRVTEHGHHIMHEADL
eukprot:m.160032 g.160032  ORF g.160032 m.160032 type:complete len:874 (+) comp11892_c0_seq1:365-2986(+)